MEGRQEERIRFSLTHYGPESKKCSARDPRDCLSRFTFLCPRLRTVVLIVGKSTS